MGDEEETGHRESPMTRNGGMASGDSGDNRYHPIYDGGVAFPPGGDGRSYPAGHPPIDCPAPRIFSGVRGLYRCPACGAKIRLAGNRDGRELGYAAADAIGGAIAQGIGLAWHVAWLSACAIARGAAWLAPRAWDRLITRHHHRQEDGSAALDNQREPDRTGAQSDRESEEESSEKEEAQPQTEEEIPVLTCTGTSDGEHVPAFRDGSARCIACEKELANGKRLHD
jgi:hypothetical protein